MRNANRKTRQFHFPPVNSINLWDKVVCITMANKSGKSRRDTRIRLPPTYSAIKTDASHF